MLPVSKTPLMLLSEFEQQNLKEVSSAGSKAKIRRFIIACGQMLQKQCNRRFDERIEIRYYDVIQSCDGGPVSGLDLYLDDDLRTVSTLTNGDTETIANEFYVLVPRDNPAKRLIRLTYASNLYWRWTTEYKDAIQVAGTWGFGGEWQSINATLSGDVNSSTTSLTVSSGAAFEVGMTLKLDNEYLLVTNISSNTLTVRRAFNGSTGAAHINGATFSYWSADEDVKLIVDRLLAWRLEQVKTPLAGQLQLGDLSLPVDVASYPADVQAAIKTLKAPANMARGGGAV